MSYILEALKKSDAERKRGAVPTLSDAPAMTDASRSGSRLPLALIAIGIMAVFGLSGLGVWLVVGNREPAHQSATETVASSTPPVEPQDAPVAVEQPAPQPESKTKTAPVATATDEPTTDQKVEPAQPSVQATSEPQPEQEAKPQAAVATPETAPKSAPETAPVSTPVSEAPATEPAPLPTPKTVEMVKAKPAPKPQEEAAAPRVPKPTYVAPPVAETPAAPPAKSDAKPVMKPLPNTSNASAYVDRAWTSMDKGLYAQAIADLDKAVAQEPAFADAWFARGWANEKNGDERAAVADYGRAIDAKPDHAFALFSRGFLNLYGGHAREAAVDFLRTQGVATDPSLKLYSHLWLYVARALDKQDAKARIQDDAQRENLAAWPGPLIRYFSGSLDEAAVLAAIEQGPRATLKERRATGFYFLGMARRLNGDAKGARPYFEKTLATGAVDFRQYEAARRELDKMN